MIDKILAKFVDDRRSLSEEELRTLVNAMREDPKLVKKLKEQLQYDNFISRNLALDRQAFPAQMEQRLRDYEFPRKVVKFPQSGRKSFMRIAMVSAACLAAGAGAFLFLGRHEHDLARVEETSSDVSVIRDGKELPSQVGMRLRPDDTLSSVGAARARIQYLQEEVSLRMEGNARVTFRQSERGGRLELANGAIDVSVTPLKPERMFIVLTSQAEVKVLGTEFRVLADSKETRVEVAVGKVRVTRLFDGMEAVVPDGQYVVAGVGGDLVARPVHSAAWQLEEWTVEEFTGALGGGPAAGPAVESGERARAICGDREGNLYLVSGQQIHIVTKDGLRFPLAGTGDSGYRDGPAEEADFRMGEKAFLGATNIQVDGGGNIFVPDSGNNCVRRIYKDERRRWTVETYAGGGKRRLAPGETGSPRDVVLAGSMAVAAAPDGALTVATEFGGCYRIDSDAKAIVFLGAWPETVVLQGGGKSLHVQSGDCDRMGNAYFSSASPGTLVRVAPDGAISHMAGRPSSPRDPRSPDGPPLGVHFGEISGCAASPDGSWVFVGVSEGNHLRRIPTAHSGRTATLLSNGRWYALRADPGRNRSSREHAFDPAQKGLPKVEGGDIGNLSATRLLGRDYEGNLYADLSRWAGSALTHKGDGLLKTGVYRLRRMK